MFQSGFTANAGTVSAILTKDDVVISDELNHASIIDGCRLSRADDQGLPAQGRRRARAGSCASCRPAQRKLLITDGVFSMDGDLGPLPALCALAEEYGCIMMVDDAHASGVFGRNGRGTVDHFGDARPRGHPGRHAVEGDRRAGRLRRRHAATSSTSCTTARGRSSSRRRIRRRSRPRASPRSTCCSKSRQIIDRLWENTRFFKAGLHALGFNTGHQREPDHAGHRRRRRARDEALGSAVRGGRVRAGHRVPDRGRATRRACARSSRRRTRARICSSRSTRSAAGRPRARDPSDGRVRCVAAPWRRPSASTASRQARAKKPGRRRLRGPSRAWEFFETYTRDLRADDFQRLFTRETPEA